MEENCCTSFYHCWTCIILCKLPKLITLKLNWTYKFLRLRYLLTPSQFSLKGIQMHLTTLRDVQYSLKGVQVHSIVIIRCSDPLNGIHAHSIPFKAWSHSFKGYHVHSSTFKRCSKLLTLTQRWSHALNCIQWVFNPFKRNLCEIKNNCSNKAFGNLINFIHRLPCGINSTFINHNFHME